MYSPEAATQPWEWRIDNVLPTFVAFNDVDPLELSGSYRIWYGKISMAGFSECHMMIDSVVWAQYINVTDTKTATSL